MTFRRRLHLFFAIIVIVPMIAVAIVLFTLLADNEHGKLDASIARGLDVALSLYSDGRAAARDDLRRVAGDRQLTAAVASGRDGAAAARLGHLVDRDPAVVSATLRSPRGGRTLRAGSRRGVAPALAVLTTPAGRRAGTLAVSVTDARRLAALAARRSRLGVVVLRDGRPVGGSRGVPVPPRGSRDFSARGKGYRGRRQSALEVPGRSEDIAVFQGDANYNGAIAKGRSLIAAVLAAFLLLALGTSVYVSRALQGQIGHFLTAARRLAGGQFGSPVPIEGDDEFAQLGHEFNRMSAQLAGQIEEVERKRRQLEDTIRRVGRAFATGLDRQASLELTVQTALDACEAALGRALPLGDLQLRETHAGESAVDLEKALDRAEQLAIAAGLGADADGRDLAIAPAGELRMEPSVAEVGGVNALALTLRAQLGTRTSPRAIGVISIARRGRAFTAQETDLLEYLAGQAVVSIENADLHETVQRQAVTDELTGLANVREMGRALDREFERGHRFDTPVGFVLLDLDDFKRINDTYGHQQGDRVLVRVASVLREHSRDIDEPARYGGEELAVVLPQTDLEGAVRLAERMRESIESLCIPRLDGHGHMQVTASFGVASVPSIASDKETLIAAADVALYVAKRGGKNRVERAEPAIVEG